MYPAGNVRQASYHSALSHRFRALLRVEELEDRNLLTAAALPALADFSELRIDQSDFAPDRILVQFNPDTVLDGGIAIASGFGAVQDVGLGIQQINLADGVSLEEALADLRNDSRIVIAEPDYRVYVDAIPNDTGFSSQWGMHNTGQSGGTSDRDIDAPEAWDRFTGNGKTIVAVIDTGVDFNHNDLKNNIWTNTGETAGDGIDNDNNGFIDDIHGWDFYNNDNNPTDDHSHGTHVAGTIAAQGNNNLGVAGVLWKSKIMALKFLGANGSGSTSGAIQAIDYARQNGAKVLNNSWGGGGFSSALSSAITRAQQAGVIVVAAAGNSGLNNDTFAHYPSSYTQDNVVAVAASTRTGGLASFSNYGVKSVDVAAPGASILSTIPNNRYATFSGTSMATPHVAGALALIWDQNTSLTYKEVIKKLYDNVDTSSAFSNRVSTGGHININKALDTNKAPNAVNDSPVTNEDTAVVINVLSNDSDPDGDTLAVTAVGDPSHGTATKNADNTITYTPEANFNGNDSFTYTISDGKGGTDTATVNVTVNAVQDPPDAVNDNVATEEDAAVKISVLANDKDPDGDTLAIQSFTDPSSGAVNDNGDGTLTYTPNSGFIGEDEFTYTINDGNGNTDTATVKVQVTEKNDPPIARNDSGSTDEDTAVSIDVLANDEDPNGDTLTVKSFTSGKNGTVTENADGSLKYAPNANYFGTDSFTYVASDGKGGEAQATVTVTVNSVNDNPVAVDDSGAMKQGESMTVKVLDNDSDVDGDTLTISGYTNPSNGAVTKNADGTFTYTPNSNYAGTDSFTYTLSDGKGGSDSATVKLTVTPLSKTYANNNTVYLRAWRVVRRTINVPDSFQIADVDLKVNISHPVTGRVAIVLQNSTTGRVLFYFHGGSGDNILANFDDEATQSIQSAAAPFNNSYRPYQSLSSFDNQNAKGNWYVDVYNYSWATGRINSVALTFKEKQSGASLIVAPIPLPPVVEQPVQQPAAPATQPAANPPRQAAGPSGLTAFDFSFESSAVFEQLLSRIDAARARLNIDFGSELESSRADEDSDVSNATTYYVTEDDFDSQVLDESVEELAELPVI